MIMTRLHSYQYAYYEVYTVDVVINRYLRVTSNLLVLYIVVLLITAFYPQVN